MKYGGCTAKLRMDRVILEDSFFDETEYLCKIIAYDEEEETLYLVSEEAELTSYSLDGIYECSIENLGSERSCGLQRNIKRTLLEQGRQGYEI